MKLRHYKILNSTSTEELAVEVNNHLMLGWSLVGGVVVSQYGVAQAIAWDVSADNEYGITPQNPTMTATEASERLNKVLNIAGVDLAGRNMDTTVVSLSTADLAPLTSKKARGRPKKK